MGKFANKDSRSHIVSLLQYFLILKKIPLFSLSDGKDAGYGLNVDGEGISESFDADSKWRKKNIRFS
jgi:hypothetical protein